MNWASSKCGTTSSKQIYLQLKRERVKKVEKREQETEKIFEEIIFKFVLISIKFPSNADATGSRTTLRETLIYNSAHNLVMPDSGKMWTLVSSALSWAQWLLGPLGTVVTPLPLGRHPVSVCQGPPPNHYKGWTILSGFSSPAGLVLIHRQGAGQGTRVGWSLGDQDGQGTQAG